MRIVRLQNPRLRRLFVHKQSPDEHVFSQWQGGAVNGNENTALTRRACHSRGARAGSRREIPTPPHRLTVAPCASKLIFLWVICRF